MKLHRCMRASAPRHGCIIAGFRCKDVWSEMTARAPDISYASPEYQNCNSYISWRLVGNRTQDFLNEKHLSIRVNNCSEAPTQQLARPLGKDLHRSRQIHSCYEKFGPAPTQQLAWPLGKDIHRSRQIHSCYEKFSTGPRF